jgi:hypothetical protein
MPLITTDKSYEFEVAFSFLKEDENLASQINDAILERYSTFIYTEQQKELVGKDGTETFRQVFEEKSRIVVVLYREVWGTTFWTRVEENAIKRRAFEESPDFTVFISLDGNKPNWLSETQIWYDFERFGIKPAAAIIEKRIAEYGGHTREESVIDRATRQKREIKRKKEIEDYLLSIQGLSDGLDEVKNLLITAEKNIEEISDHSLGLAFGINKKEGEYFSSFGRKVGLKIKWNRRYSESLSGSCLHIVLADGDYFDDFPGEKGYIYLEEAYVFYQNIARSKGWVKRKDKTGFMSSEQLLNLWQKKFLDQNEENQNRARY